MPYQTSFGPEGLARHKRAAQSAAKKQGHVLTSWRDDHAELSYATCQNCQRRVGVQSMTGMSRYVYGSAIDQPCTQPQE